MSIRSDPSRSLPSRRQAALFQGKAILLRARRAWRDLGQPVPRATCRDQLGNTSPLAEVTATLWTHQSAAEFPLTAGKVQNLRVACGALHGLEFAAGATFSFWRQLGRTTKRKGYTAGRELREGCLVANRGGGLCQLSNLLYMAALEAGFEIVERHPHSRTIPGSLAEQDRDATVFWNYVDLRFRAPVAFRLETVLSATELLVRIRAREQQPAVPTPPSAPPAPGTPVRSNPSGDCLSCGMTSCFRHPTATGSHRPAAGHTAFLLDELWPEFQGWCRKHSQDGDHWFLPLDGHRWRKANYAWSPPDSCAVHHATGPTLAAAFRTRRLPAQGATRQRALLHRSCALASHYARTLDPKARHLVIAQPLLPHLWLSGALGGRTFDVLMTRWPITELQRRLDVAARRHSASTTLGDFRADPILQRAEEEALAAAARLLTPHRALATHFGARALLLDWHFPSAEDPAPARVPHRLFFPASPLGRKGVFELAAALRGLDAELLVLGSAREGAANPLASTVHRSAPAAELLTATALVLPAWIEHQPRLALRALANDLPVIATAACGLPAHPSLWQIEDANPDALHAILADLLASRSGLSTRRAS